MINSTYSYRMEEAIQLSMCSLLSIAGSEGTKCQVNPYFFVSVNVILSITTLLGNILILIALHKDLSLHPPSKLLFRCLSCTDLFEKQLSVIEFLIGSLRSYLLKTLLHLTCTRNIMLQIHNYGPGCSQRDQTDQANPGLA